VRRINQIIPFVAIITIVIAVIIPPATMWKGATTTISGWDLRLLALLEPLGMIFVLYLILFILFQFIGPYFSPRIIFEGLSNEADLLAADLKPINFSKLAWEELVDQSHILTKQWRQYKSVSDDNTSSETDWVAMLSDAAAVPPLDLLTQDLPWGDYPSPAILLPETNILDWVKLVEGKVPKEYSLILNIVSFFGAAMPPSTTRIIGHLQNMGDTGKVGITLEIMDPKNTHNFEICSFWQDKSRDSPSTRSTDQSGPEKPSMQSYRALLRPAMRWLLLMSNKQKEGPRLSQWSGRKLKAIEAKMSQMFLKQKEGSRLSPRHRKKLEDRRKKASKLYLLGALSFASAQEFAVHHIYWIQEFGQGKSQK
jgi:hypothetical protein